jgi:hypothetical protein
MNMPVNISTRSQIALIWWAWIFMIVFGLAYYFLIGMLPLPPANWSAPQVADFYAAHSLRIRLGAAICSWTGAFMVPLATVIAAQMSRLEKGFPIWSLLQFGGGLMMSIFLVLPPLFWGTAAFSPHRPIEVTLLMHEFANLTLVTTDQYFIFQNVAIGVVSLTQKVDPKSPFPRWLGYFTLWAALIYEVGVAGFIPRSGPFSWNGLFVYWFPLATFGTWMTVMSFNLLTHVKRQAAEGR